MDDLNATIEQLIERQLAARLPRRPGQREERYTHLLGGEDVPDAMEQPAPAMEQPAPAIEHPTPADDFEQRFERLEREIAELRAELHALRQPRSG
jgi:uncharacterized protein YceH (UPF0502 family)